jgi:hypothetical protein
VSDHQFLALLLSASLYYSSREYGALVLFLVCHLGIELAVASSASGVNNNGGF